jgi:perosamine synthetase
MCPEDLEKLITDNTGAILVTHLHGLSADMKHILAKSKDRNIPVVEDAAQSFGTRLHGDHIGSLGDIGVYSFGQFKNINSFFGGMMVTSNDQIAKIIRTEIAAFPFQERDYFLSKMFSNIVTDIVTWPPLFKFFTFWIFRTAMIKDIAWLNRKVIVDESPTSKTVLPETYLRRMTPTQAELILDQIDNVSQYCQQRIDTAKKYHDGLSGLSTVRLPPLRLDSSHTYSYYPVAVENRPEVIKMMMEKYCDIAAQHLKNCADLECFSKYFRDCPNARKIASDLILLPTYPRYKMRDIERNISVLQDMFGHR